MRMSNSELDCLMYLVEGMLHHQDAMDPAALRTALASTQVSSAPRWHHSRDLKGPPSSPVDQEAHEVALPCLSLAPHTAGDPRHVGGVHGEPGPDHRPAPAPPPAALPGVRGLPRSAPTAGPSLEPDPVSAVLLPQSERSPSPVWPDRSVCVLICGRQVLPAARAAHHVR